jgi:hypothetical protein
MSIWHSHEGAARLILWLLFKTKVGNDPCDAGTLLRVAFGSEKVEEARQVSATRKRIIAQWKTSLKVLDRHGWKLTFDPATYPPQYLPTIAASTSESINLELLSNLVYEEELSSVLTGI